MTLNINTITFGILFEMYHFENKKQKYCITKSYGGLNYVTRI